jgi:arginyl-tRNA synthetase
MKDQLKTIIVEAAGRAFEGGLLPSPTLPDMEIDIPKFDTHGDFSTNAAMLAAGVLKMAPRKIAQALVDSVRDPSGLIEKMEIAGPGFINFFLRDSAWHGVLGEVHRRDRLFGSSDFGRGTRVQVEFVSANPTGPLHVGHGRGAAVGDAVAAILKFCGYDVQKEYYINDSGRQIRTLGLSVWLRLKRLRGMEVDFPQDCYQGDYVLDIARRLDETMGDELMSLPEPEALSLCATRAAGEILEGIRTDLADFGVTFDRWFSEQSLYDDGTIARVIEDYRRKDTIYEKDGALWFTTEAYGDEKDRVVVRNNGLTTYFASDIAYHMEKFDRGFDRVIDVWGADHHGYIKRIRASIEASGRSADQFDVILIHLVALLRNGQPVAMSTRSGEFVTLRDILDEVGRDAARFLFLSRSYESGLDFDLEVAKQQTSENPVYYVQYVHARIHGILVKAGEEAGATGEPGRWMAYATRLTEPEELKLIKVLGAFPGVVERCARTLHPHGVFTYLMGLAAVFHAYYNRHKVITRDADLTRARLCLVSGVAKVIRNGLSLLGVSAPERM